MGTLRILDMQGDSESTWSPEVEAETAKALAEFDSAVKDGYAAFTVFDGDKKPTLLQKFDPSAKEIILTPMMIPG